MPLTTFMEGMCLYIALLSYLQQGIRLLVWSDIPHPLLHLRIRPTFPRSYLSSYQASFGSLTPFFAAENHDQWDGKRTLSTRKMFTPDSDSSKEKEDLRLLRHQKSDNTYESYPPNIGRAYFEGVGVYESYPPRSTIKPQGTVDLDKIVSQMRISTKDGPKESDINVVRPLPIRPTSTRNQRETSSTPNESDESISGDSLGTSSGNSFTSVNGIVSNNVPQKNKVNLERIQVGLDKRTTIMIKNVPNKYTQVRSSIVGLMVANAHGVC
jgi:hypothetical protein